jgi:hypothetical protein
MSARRGPGEPYGEPEINRLLRSWLREDWHETGDRVVGAVLDQLDTTAQRRSVWSAWRFQDMNNVLRVGLVAAAVVIIAVIALNLLPGTPAPGGGPTPSPSGASSGTPAATPSEFTLAIQEWNGIQAVVTVPASWTTGPGYVTDGNSQITGIYLGAYPVQNVYGDPCRWQGSLPDPGVGPTVDDLATALVNQPTRDATAADITIDGFGGQVVTLHTPAGINFADCDGGTFGTWTEAGSDEPSRYSQGPGQAEDVYILDVGGTRIVLDASYFPDASSPDNLAELADIIDSIDIQP